MRQKTVVWLFLASFLALPAFAQDAPDRSAYRQRVEAYNQSLQKLWNDKNAYAEKLKADLDALKAHLAEVDTVFRRVDNVPDGQWLDARKEADAFFRRSSTDGPLAAKRISDEWSAAKDFYRSAFHEAIDLSERHISSLKGEMDYGDPKVRDQIAEDFSDATRDMDRLKQDATEIKAAGLVDFSHIKQRMSAAVQDMKD